MKIFVCLFSKTIRRTRGRAIYIHFFFIGAINGAERHVSPTGNAYEYLRDFTIKISLYIINY